VVVHHEHLLAVGRIDPLPVDTNVLLFDAWTPSPTSAPGGRSPRPDRTASTRSYAAVGAAARPCRCSQLLRTRNSYNRAVSPRGAAHRHGHPTAKRVRQPPPHRQVSETAAEATRTRTVGSHVVFHPDEPLTGAGTRW
jgi:hypothetical protein